MAFGEDGLLLVAGGRDGPRAALALGFIHGLVGPPQRGVHAFAKGDLHNAKAQGQRGQLLVRCAPLHFGHDARGNADGVAGRGVAQQQHKFVATLATRHVVGTQVFEHGRAHHAQGTVASGVTEEIVDALEVVDVKVQQHGGAGLVLLQGLLGQFVKVPPVGHLGQGVHVGQHPQAAP